MKSLVRLICLSFLILAGILHSCKKEEIPTLTTATVTNITGTSATSGGTITDEGSGTIVERGICWSKGITPTIADNRTIEGGGAGTFISNMSNLDGATTYYVRAYGTNVAGTGYGMAMSFTTLGQVPVATTQSATNVTTTSATLNGLVNANYLSTTVTFEYGTTTSYGQTVTASQSPVTGNSNTNVTSEITGLTEGTTYHFRVKTVNSLGTTTGNDMSFKTLGQAPTAMTESACCFSSTGATLNGTVNANYISTTVTFEYGTTTAYGISITATPSPVTGNNSTSVRANISGLNPGTTYHFRIKAVNSLGTTYGNDVSFTSTSNVYGLYTIKIGTDELYFIDLNTNSLTKVGDIGLVIPSAFTEIKYKDHKLYIYKAGSIYSYDLNSCTLDLVINNPNLGLGFSFNSSGDLYTLLEVTDAPPGTLYKIDIATNTSTKIGTTTGTPSILGIKHDANDQLWAVEEFAQRFGIINTETGIISFTSPTFPYTDMIYLTTDNKGYLYTVNVGTSPLGIVRYDITNNTASHILTMSGYSGLEYARKPSA